MTDRDIRFPFQKIEFLSSADNTSQMSLLLPAKSREKRPLAVVLHTWSADLFQVSSHWYAQHIVKHDFHMAFPNFRGPNWRKDGCGSEKVVADIASLVADLKKRLNVDENRIYLIGASGGGHAALLLAGRHPELWNAVSAWCPISDIAAWHKENFQRGPYQVYASHIEQALGGNPNEDKLLAQEAWKRSPLAYMKNAKGIPLDINTGIHDGHKGGSVSVLQSIWAYNLLADKKDRLTEEEMNYIREKEAIPAHLANEREDDPAYGKLKVLFRRVSGAVRLTIFEGGHQSSELAGVGFLANQCRGKKADFSLVECEDSIKENEILK